MAESKKMGMPLGSTLYSLGFITLEQLKAALHQQQGIEVEDLGCYSEDSCDYPVIAKAVAENR